FATINGLESIVQLLLKEGASPNIADFDGDTALLLASGRGHHKIVELLLQKGADPNIANTDGDTPLQLASGNGHQKVVELLIASGTTGPSKSKRMDASTRRRNLQRGLKRLAHAYLQLSKTLNTAR
ncbi:ankyrin repeat-containing domain protein, partial [Dactylonectria estremocensis]